MGLGEPSITHMSQDISDAALASLPADMSAPLGQLVFTADVLSTQQDFSLFIETALGVNGYWKQTPAGDWVNLASALYGGNTTVLGDVTRLDFHIQDNGPFDADPTPGVISDPGVLGQYNHGLVGVVGETPPVDHWF